MCGKLTQFTMRKPKTKNRTRQLINATDLSAWPRKGTSLIGQYNKGQDGPILFSLSAYIFLLDVMGNAF